VRLARPLVLASASPRRREILARLGLSFEVAPSDLDESQRVGEDPRAYVARLAEEKARAVGPRTDSVAVLGTDTTVVLEGEILAKPRDLADSERMLRALRGREHEVHTGVAVVLFPEGTARGVTLTTRVRFRAFDDATLRAYAASGEGRDKAGSYGIQDLGAALVSEIRGSYGAVVGLPAAETIELLTAAGVLEAWP
jgi:septum formation protein